MQYPLGIPPALRTNVDYVFILRENIMSNRKRIYENYASMFATFEAFCSVLDSCTKFLKSIKHRSIIFINTFTTRDNTFT